MVYVDLLVRVATGGQSFYRYATTAWIRFDPMLGMN